MPSRSYTPESFAILLERYLDNRCSVTELDDLLELLDDPDYQALATDLIEATIDSRWNGASVDHQLRHPALEARLAAILEPPVSHLSIRRSLRWAAAAAILIILSVATFKYFGSKEATPIALSQNIHIPAPDKNRSIIVLNNGDSINLDNIQGGKYVTNEGIVITKLADGQISYSGETNVEQAIYNTAINPKGSTKMRVSLHDGTEIWLNAGSSMKYPLVFREAIRKVTINGEAYLEVAHDARHPFIVEKGNTSVTVLGTRFNVKAYDNEPNLKVTLLQGSVKVQQNEKKQLLAPNQQAVVSANKIVFIPDADIDEATAWMKDNISFHSVDLSTALRELERWYDIETEIKATGIIKKFYTDVPRKAKLKDMLKVLLDDNDILYEFDPAKRKLTIVK